MNLILHYYLDADPHYFAVVWGLVSSFPADPFTLGTGGGVGSTEDYDGAVSISDEDQDTEYDLEINLDCCD